MGIDQLSEPCRACGHPKRYRQSCANCASMERAKLHAAGVCMLEGLEQTRSQALAGPGGTFANPAAEPPKFDFQRLREACDRIYRKPIPTLSTPDPRTKAGSSPLSQACAAAEEARRLTGVVPYAVATPRPGRTHIQWDGPPDPDHGMHRWNHVCLGRGCAQPHDEQGWRWRVVGGVIVFDEAERMVREHAPGIRGHKLDHVVVDEPRPAFQRIYQGTWEDGSPVYTNACGMPSRTPEPPPVGAEVGYDVALDDMKRRPEARYSRGSGDEYRVAGGQFQYANRFYTRGKWEEVGSPCERDQYKRLPDATTVPEAEQELVWPKVGEECSWEVAECHMRRDASATYKHTVDGEMFRHRCERGCHMYWDKRHSEWRVSQASRSYLARGEWVRLA